MEDEIKIGPPDFDQYGHLSEKYAEVKPDIYKLAPEFFDTTIHLNAVAQDALYAISIKVDSNIEYVRSLLFLHILRSYQALVNLIFLGLQEQAILMMRTMMETMFKLKALTEKPELLDKYFNEHDKHRVQIGKNILRLRDECGVCLCEKGQYEEYEIELEQLKKQKISTINAAEWAKEADELSRYLMLYPLFSQPAHANPHQLDKYLILDKEGEIIGPDPYPKYDQIRKTIHHSMCLLTISIECIDDLLHTPDGKSPFSVRLKIINNKLSAIADETEE